MLRFDEMLGFIPRFTFGVDENAGLWLLFFELLFWAAVFVIAAALFRFRPQLVERAEARINSFAQRPRVWLVVFGLGVVAIRLALLPLLPIPTPKAHDEYSYLLAADTFAHGRITNPPSAMGVHFESFHINVFPTYQSMYPPAQGLALGIAQALTGVPWIGVVLSTALLCSAIYWMLLGWLPRSWAWIGGVFSVARFGIFSYWMNTYFGGSVAALGGALVLGSLPRLRSGENRAAAVLFATGLLIMANSRPLEGLVFSLPLITYIGWTMTRNHECRRRLLNNAGPALALLIIGFAWMGYYNWRSTGSPVVMPYTVNFETYHISKPFMYQAPRPIPEYHHQSMRAVYVMWELPDVQRLKYDLGFFIRQRAGTYYSFFLWPFCFIVAPALLAIWRSELRIVLVSATCVCATIFAEMWRPSPHYAAPATAAVILLVLYSVRHFRTSHGEYGVWWSRALAMLLAVWMITPILEYMHDPFELSPKLWGRPDPIRLTIPLELQRARIEAHLATLGGKHLVIVNYPPHDVPFEEWVYNRADLGHSPVIWARDMGWRKNQELLNYYHDRQVWYVEHGETSGARLVPYAQATTQWALSLGPSTAPGNSQPTQVVAQNNQQ